MKKYRAKTKAIFNGQPVGSIIELEEKIAKKYESLKYLKIIEEVKPKRKSTAKKEKAKKKEE